MAGRALGVTAGARPGLLAAVAFDYIARLCLRGPASEYWVVQKLAEILIQNVHSSEICEPPPGPLNGLTDERGAGRGRRGAGG